ncbi:MAG: hypothetical protein ACLU7M_00920 [Mediterraneibacter gnavus]
MTEKDYETEEFRLYVTGFNGHNPFYKQTAYLDFRWGDYWICMRYN